MKGFLPRLIFFVGWLLSPLTFWNDSFINIPLSYILANIFIRIFPVNFLSLLLAFYWLSNALGIFMMYASGKKIIEERKGLVRSVLTILATIAIYSLVLITLERAGILKPI